MKLSATVRDRSFVAGDWVFLISLPAAAVLLIRLVSEDEQAIG